MSLLMAFQTNNTVPANMWVDTGQLVCYPPPHVSTMYLVECIVKCDISTSNYTSTKFIYKYMWIWCLGLRINKVAYIHIGICLASALRRDHRQTLATCHCCHFCCCWWCCCCNGHNCYCLHRASHTKDAMVPGRRPLSEPHYMKENCYLTLTSD